MLWAQWLLLVLVLLHLVCVLIVQGKTHKSTFTGWHVFAWMLSSGLLFAAGAFSGIVGAP